MLTRGGGATAYQRVVSKVSDLPSPIDAVPGERIIVRETEEVYAIDATTRMWSVIGTLKKVGGKRPEDIAVHLDSNANPHKTTLAQVISGGAAIDLDEKTGEFVVDDKSGKLKALLRLLKTGGALRVGPDVGNSTATIWVNAGKKGPKAAVLRIVEGDAGEDQFVLEGDGSIKSAGSAEFKGGIKGELKVQGGLFALGGINGGESLGLVGKRICLFTDKGKVILTDQALALSGNLEVAGDLDVGGTVSSDLNPADDRKQTLGTPNRRWKGIVAASVGIASEQDESAFIVKVKPGQKAPILLVGQERPGDILALDQDGDLGLGTLSPERKLDVQGSGLAVGSPVGKARFSIADEEDGDVQISFNRAVDDSFEDEAIHSWTTVPGGKRDAFEILRRAKGGNWKSLFKLDQSGLKLTGDLSVTGEIKTAAGLALPGVSNQTGESGVDFKATGTAVEYYAQKPLAGGAVHTFRGAWKNAAAKLDGIVLDIDDQGSAIGSTLLKLLLNGESVFEFCKGGRLLGAKLGDTGAPWAEAFVKALMVGKTALVDGKLSTAADLELAPTTGLVKMGNRLVLGSTKVTAEKGSVTIEDELPIVLGTKKGFYGLDFPAGGATISNLREVDADHLMGGRLTVDSETDQLAVFMSKSKLVMGLTAGKMTLNGSLNVGGFNLEKLQEVVELTGEKVQTKFKLPAGVRVEAVVATVMEEPDITFFSIGDANVADRFLGPSTKVTQGAVSKGLNHCDRGQSAQHVEAPLVITSDAAPTCGKLLVTAFFMNPNAT